MATIARTHLDVLLTRHPVPAARAVARVVATDLALVRHLIITSGLPSLVAAIEHLGAVQVGRMAESCTPVVADVRAAGLRAELAARIAQGIDPAAADLAYTAGLLCTLGGSDLPGELTAAIEGISRPQCPAPAAAAAAWHAVRAIAGLEQGDIDAARAACQACGQDVDWIDSWWVERVVGMPPAPCPLTRSELRVLRELAGRRVVKEAAHSLGCSPNTVYNHLHNAYRKLEVSGQSHALLAARESGWL